MTIERHCEKIMLQVWSSVVPSVTVTEAYSRSELCVDVILIILSVLSLSL